VKCACNVAHHARNESEVISAERKGRAGRSREKMNAKWMWENDSCERLESISSQPLSLCIFVFSDRNAHSVCVVREQVAVQRAPRRGAMT